MIIISAFIQFWIKEIIIDTPNWLAWRARESNRGQGSLGAEYRDAENGIGEQEGRRSPIPLMANTQTQFEAMGDLLISAFLRLLLSIVVLLGGVIYSATAKLGLQLHIPCHCSYGGRQAAKECEDNGAILCDRDCERCSLQSKPRPPSPQPANLCHRRSVKRKACHGVDEEEEEEEEEEKQEEEKPERQSEVESLRKALRIEQEARNAVYAELEKERNAAASAADEAMAMILRLQKEKAAVQIESRQFRRMVEQKQLHDQQAIRVLRDILASQEREKFALRRQLDLCRLGQRQENDFKLNDFASLRVDADVDVQHGTPGVLFPNPSNGEVSYCANGADGRGYDSDFQSANPPLHTKSVIVEEDQQSVKNTVEVQTLEEMAEELHSSASYQVERLLGKKRPSGP